MEQWEGPERFEVIQTQINGEEIKTAARWPGDSGSWTRKRSMPLADILRCTLFKKGLTTTMELRQYFQAADKMEQQVSKQDYLKQRKKLNPEVFRELNRIYLQKFYGGKEVRRWQGMVVLAVDGSRVEIPDSAENRETYGESENKYGKAVARANFSAAYDVYNRFMVDIGIHHFRSSEIEEARAHLPTIREVVGEQPALLIFDRNYPSLEFVDYLEKAGVNYLIRLHSKDYKAERAGMGGPDEAVELEHTAHRLRQIRQTKPGRAEELAGEPSTPARIIKMVFKDGEPGALITNLGMEHKAGDIKRLYRKRWLLEQKYHTLKNKMKFESVTGKASIYVKQDFWAQTLVFNMVQDVLTGAEMMRRRRYSKQKQSRYQTRINENIAIGLYKEQFIRLILEEDPQKKDRMFVELKEEMMRNIVPIRASPGAPRRWQYFNKYKCNQKTSF